MRNLKRITKRALAGTLAALLLFTSAPTNAYAIEPMDTTGMEQNVAVEEIEELLEEEFANEGEEVLDEQSKVSAEEIVDENEGKQENTETPEEVVEENTETENTEVDEEGITDEETPEEELSEEELSEEKLSEEELLEEELLEELSEDEVISEEVEALSEAPDITIDVTAPAADTQSSAIYNDHVGLYQKDVVVNKADGNETPKIGSISGMLYKTPDVYAPYKLVLHLESDVTKGSYTIYLDTAEPEIKQLITESGVDIDVAMSITEENETLSVKYYDSEGNAANFYEYDLNLTFDENEYLTVEALTELPAGLPASFPKDVNLAGLQSISEATDESITGNLYDVNGKWYVLGKVSTSVEGANIYVKGNLLNTSDGTFAVEVDRKGETLNSIDYYLYRGSWKNVYENTLLPWPLNIEGLARKSLVTASPVAELPATLPQDIASAVTKVDDIQIDVEYNSNSVSGTLKPVNEKFYLLGKLTAAEGFTVSVENNLITESATGEFLVDLTSADAKLSAIVKKDDTVVRTIDYNLTMLKKPDIARYNIYPYSTPKQNIAVKMSEDGTSGVIEGTIEARCEDSGVIYCLSLGVNGANFEGEYNRNVISVKTDAGDIFDNQDSAYICEIDPSNIPEKIIVSLDEKRPYDSNITNIPLELDLKLTLINTIEVNIDIAPATDGVNFDGDSIKDFTASVNGVRVSAEGGCLLCNVGDTYAITMEAYDGAKIVKADISTGSANTKTVKVNKQKYTYTGVAGKDDVNITIYGEDPIIGNIMYHEVETSKDKNGVYSVQIGLQYSASMHTSNTTLSYDDEDWTTVEVYDSEGELVNDILTDVSDANRYHHFKVAESILPNEIYSMVFKKDDQEVTTIKFTLLPTNKLKLTLYDYFRTNKKISSFSIQNGSYVAAQISTVPMNASMAGVELKVLNSKGEVVSGDGSQGIEYDYERDLVEIGATPASKDAKDKYTAVFYDSVTGDTIAKYPITFKPAKMGKPIITCLGTSGDCSEFLVQYPADILGDYGGYYYQYVWKDADGKIISPSTAPVSISDEVLEGEPIEISDLPSAESSKYTLEVTFVKKVNDVVYAESSATYTLSNRFASSAKDFKVKQVSKSGYLGQEVVLAKIEYAKDVAYRGKPTLEILNIPSQVTRSINVLFNNMSRYDEQTGELSIQLLEADVDFIMELSLYNIDLNKLKLRIRPNIPEGCYSSVYKDVNFSINMPIMDIGINPDPIEIVKKPGKAATGKFSLNLNQFNDDPEMKQMISVYFPKGLLPKSNKVKYLLLDGSGDPVEGVTVKNGKISVSKDYVIQGNSFDYEHDLAFDCLWLYVKPDDYEGHVWGGVSPFEVRIYEDSVKYAEVVPVIYDGYSFVRAGSTLAMGDLYWNYVETPKVYFFVRPSNVPVKDRYGVDELIKDGFTLTSSNKNVKLEKVKYGDAESGINVYCVSAPISAAKNVVFTAKSNADTKVSAKSGKLNIVSDSRDDFGIYLNNQYLYYDNNEVIDATSLNMSEVPITGSKIGMMVILQVYGLDKGRNLEDIKGQGDFKVTYKNAVEFPNAKTEPLAMLLPGMTYVMPKDVSKPVVITVKDNILRKTKKFTINFVDNGFKATCNEIVYNNTNPGVELYTKLKAAWNRYCDASSEQKEYYRELLEELVDMVNLPKYRIDITVPKKYYSIIDEGAFLTMPNAKLDMYFDKNLFSFEAGISMATSFVNPDAIAGKVPIYKDANGYYTYIGWLDEMTTKAGKYTVGMAILNKEEEMISGIIPITVTLKNQKVNFKAPTKVTSITFNGKDDAVDLKDVVTLGKGCEGIVAISTADSLDDGLPTGFSDVFEINDDGKIVISDSAKDKSLEVINACGSGYIKYIAYNAVGVKTSGYLKVKITVTE